jgi:hypothetical protein
VQKKTKAFKLVSLGLKNEKYAANFGKNKFFAQTGFLKLITLSAKSEDLVPKGAFDQFVQKNFFYKASAFALVQKISFNIKSSDFRPANLRHEILKIYRKNLTKKVFQKTFLTKK